MIKKLLQNRRVMILLIVLLCLISYSNIYQNQFAWDDSYFFQEWPQIKSSPGLPAYLNLPDLLKGDLPLDHRGVYRPVRSIYYLVSYAIWGENPVGYHIQAVIVHTLISIVVFLIAESITRKKIIALMVGVLFATHPVHVEAVTYMTASFDTLGILFFFLSFYFYLKSQVTQNKKNVLILASIIYSTLAFFTYEMTLVLPLLIVAYDWCQNSLSFTKILKNFNVYKFYFLSLISYLFVRFVVIGIGNRADYLGFGWEITARAARVGFLEILWSYLVLLIWPINLTSTHQIPNGLLTVLQSVLNRIDPSQHLLVFSAQISMIYPILFITLFALLGILLLKKFPLVLYGFLWFLISLLTVINIFPQGQTNAERFLYIPSFGFSLIVGIAIYYLAYKINHHKSYKFLRLTPIALFILVTLFYTGRTILRNEDWKTNKSLWQSAINTNPSISLPYGALGVIYAQEEQYDKSAELFLKGISLDPYNEKLHADLGLVYDKKGLINQAISQYKKSAEVNPGFYFAYIYLGNLYQRQGKQDFAIEQYKTALKYKKNDAVTLTYLGDAYFNQKNYDNALRFYLEALKNHPTSHILINKIGQVYFLQSKYDQAITAAKNSMELNPKESLNYILLSEVYKKQNDLQKARDILNKGYIETNNESIKQALSTF